MGGHDRHDRARERLRAAQAGAGGTPGASGDRAMVLPDAGKTGPVGPAGDRPPAAGAAGTEGTGAWSAQHAAARTEGLELTAVLGTGRGTRTWLATEQHSREKFTVTFCTAPDPARRAAQHRALQLVARYWAGHGHDHLVPVRALLGDPTAPALVTDHVAATSLAALTVQDGRLSPARLTPVLVAVATALAALHDREWVHGTLTAQRVLLAADGRVWLDGYGVPCRAPDGGGPIRGAEAAGIAGAVDVPAPSWGHEDRPEPADRPVARTPPEDVKALAALAWHALTGRYPGSDTHRVPLTLLCPAAPRGLVLVLEAALQDEPQRRPTAREFAAGVAALPTPRATTRGDGPTQIIRANGTVEAVRTGPAASRRTPEVLRALRSEDGHRFAALAAALPRSGRRWPVAALAGAAVLLVAGWAGWTRFGPGEGDAAPATPSRAGEVTAPGGTAAAQRAGPTGGPAATVVPATPGDPPRDAAQRAVRELVARRAEALAAGDERALAHVYLPDSPLARRDRETVARALAQRGPGTEYSALSGLSMEVDTIHPLPAPAEEGRARAANNREQTFYAEILTRGWHGELPEGSHVRREHTAVRQSVRITVVRSPEGWRLATVTPVAARE